MDKIQKARFINLSWDLLAYKLYYYYPEKVHPSWKHKLDIPDGDYDELEREYVQLCSTLGEPNTVESMVQLDLDRPSVQQVLKKYSQRRRK
jgi:hypothetical protein